MELNNNLIVAEIVIFKAGLESQLTAGELYMLTTNHP